MIEPHQESCIIASIFHWTPPSSVRCYSKLNGIALEWNFYIGRGYPLGLGRADFSDLDGLVGFQIARHRHSADFRYRYRLPTTEQPWFFVEPDRLHRPTTKFALRYLLAKNVDISGFESQYNYPVDYHTRMEWGLWLNESLKRWSS